MELIDAFDRFSYCTFLPTILFIVFCMYHIYDGMGENMPADGMRHKTYPGRGGACSSRFVRIGSAKRGEAEYFAVLQE